MRYTSVIVVSAIAFSQAVLAQTGSCAAQDVFDKCLSMEDDYLKTCTQQDYACLCKWHQAKLSCYDNCPNNLGRAAQEGLKDTFCSIVIAQNKTASAISSIASSATSVLSPSGSVTSTTISPSSVSNSTTNNNAQSTSSASNTYYSHGILMGMAGLTAYYLF